MKTVFVCLGILLSVPLRVGGADIFHVRVFNSETQEHGQGALFRWRDACFALTAGHVLKRGAVVTLTGGVKGEPLGAGHLERTFPQPDDLAILRVSGALETRQFCDATLHDFQSDPEILTRGSGLGSITYVDELGEQKNTQIVITYAGPKIAAIRRGDGRPFMGGQSGSLLFKGQKPVGMLLRSTSDGDQAMVTMGRILELIEKWATEAKVPPGIVRHDASLPSGKRPGNLLVNSRGARLLEWNTIPLAPDYGPHQLLQGNGSMPWVPRKAADGRAWVVIRLSPRDDSIVFDRVEVETPRSEPPERWVSEIEFQYSETGEPGSWRTFGEILRVNIHAATSRMLRGPVRARFIKVLLLKNHGDANYFAVGSIALFGPLSRSNGLGPPSKSR